MLAATGDGLVVGVAIVGSASGWLSLVELVR